MAAEVDEAFEQHRTGQGGEGGLQPAHHSGPRCRVDLDLLGRAEGPLEGEGWVAHLGDDPQVSSSHGILQVVGHRLGEGVDQGPQIPAGPRPLQLLGQHGSPSLDRLEVHLQDLLEEALLAPEVVVERGLVAGPHRVV